jgi:hypothetical protein
MDQSAQPHHNQIAKPTPQSLLFNHRGSASSSSFVVARETSESAVVRAPLGAFDRAKPKFAAMFAEPPAAGASVKRPPSAACKLSTIELEVQLAERLNEIERSKVRSCSQDIVKRFISRSNIAGQR